jgi:hypothetical protein
MLFGAWFFFSVAAGLFTYIRRNRNGAGWFPALFELLPVPIPQQTLYARNDSTWRASFSSVW